MVVVEVVVIEVAVVVVVVVAVVGVDSASNRNKYQEYFLGVKAAGA